MLNETWGFLVNVLALLIRLSFLLRTLSLSLFFCRHIIAPCAALGRNLTVKLIFIKIFDWTALKCKIIFKIYLKFAKFSLKLGHITRLLTCRKRVNLLCGIYVWLNGYVANWRGGCKRKTKERIISIWYPISRFIFVRFCCCRCLTGYIGRKMICRKGWWWLN